MNRKFITGFILALMGVYGVLAAPGVMAAVNDVTFQSYTGHSLGEESFAFIYDVVGDHLVQDLTPGPYAANLSADKGGLDSDLDVDSNFYVTYTNMGQVQTLYIANINTTLDRSNLTRYGCAPYQLLINHFRTLGNLDVFTVSTFVGLVAYREGNESANGVPDSGDEMYVGWTAFSELYKHLFNLLLERSNIPVFARYDPNVRATATPLPLTKSTEDGNTTLVYRYGMSYKNIFVVWQKIDTSSGLNDTGDNPEILVTDTVAVGMLSSLNFSFIVKGAVTTSGLTNITISTEYEIGEMSSLWVLNDSAFLVQALGGTPYVLALPGGPTPVGYYNTSSAIQARLSGNDQVPGFGLAVATYTDMVVIGTVTPEQVIRNKLGDQIDPEKQNMNISRADIMLKVRNRLVKAFEISYEGKDTYILGGDVNNPKKAIGYVVPNTRLRSPIATFMYFMARDFLVGLFKAVYPDFGPIQEIKFIKNPTRFFFLTCFPEWSGKSIVNDPTFTVIAGANVAIGEISAAPIYLIALVSAGAVTALIIARRRKRA